MYHVGCHQQRSHTTLFLNNVNEFRREIAHNQIKICLCFLPACSIATFLTLRPIVEIAKL